MALMISCRRATLLIEERADARLPLAERAALVVHLAYCRYCRRYAAQSPLVGQLALFAAQRQLAGSQQLPAAAHLRIQQQIEQRLEGGRSSSSPDAGAGR